MVNESASKKEQDNTTHAIRVNVDNVQGDLGEWNSLSYTPSRAYCTAILGYSRDRLQVLVEVRIGIRYRIIG